jgi:predicted negative regulator of RcsB-dependent stress response
MTTPNTELAAPSRQPKAESFIDWFHVNSRWVGIGAVVVLIAAVVAWYIPRARQQKNENADKRLVAAKQSIGSGNIQLAESDLKKTADQYAGTNAGTEAGLLLAQLKLDRGDAAGAVTYLQDLASKVGTSPSASSVRGLLGDALAQANKTADAAAEYERAAGATNMPNERATLLAKAGHAYMDAGKADAAKRIWQQIEVQQENPGLAAEARVRLGEIEASARS